MNTFFRHKSQQSNPILYGGFPSIPFLGYTDKLRKRDRFAQHLQQVQSLHLPFFQKGN
jgi:hypothetical protein